MSSNIVLGIDASNLLQGGGRTHLVELLLAFDPSRHGCERIIIWGRRTTLAVIPEHLSIEKRWLPALEKGVLWRALWQRRTLPRLAREAGVQVLFSPGGSAGRGFIPVVTMSRNMLPFEWRELRRYGVSLMALRLLLLRFAQARSFRNAAGVIFLTQYARERVVEAVGALRGSIVTIPHGIGERFFAPVRGDGAGGESCCGLRLTYVSITDVYKHQWQIVEAVHRLRAKGYQLKLDLVGPAYPAARRRLLRAMDRADPRREWVREVGSVSNAALTAHYACADIGIFASSCENMPNILLETMASGLPVACSRCGPMPEILGDAGVYFDPEEPDDIARALRALIDDPERRERCAQASVKRARAYSWARCADETFAFLALVARSSEQGGA